MTRYILRNDDFTENLNLHDFEKAAMEIIKPVDYMSVKNNGFSGFKGHHFLIYILKKW